MTTVLDILDKGTAYLEKRGIEDARRNMQWLVAHHLGCDRLALYTQFDRPLGFFQAVAGELVRVHQFASGAGRLDAFAADL